MKGSERAETRSALRRLRFDAHNAAVVGPSQERRVHQRVENSLTGTMIEPQQSCCLIGRQS